MSIKDILKRRRTDLGLTMKDLAHKVGVSEGTISRWESGDIENMRRDKIAALASALEISPAVIMGWNTAAEFGEGVFLTPDESALLSDYNRLNDLGKEKARGDVADLTQIPKYTGKVVPFRKEEVYLEAAHHKPVNDPEGDAFDDSIMDDENF